MLVEVAGQHVDGGHIDGIRRVGGQTSVISTLA